MAFVSCLPLNSGAWYLTSAQKFSEWINLEKYFANLQLQNPRANCHPNSLSSITMTGNPGPTVAAESIEGTAKSYSLTRVSHHVVRRLNGPQAEKWRTPIHSSVSHFGNGSSSPSPAFRWLQAQPTSWLWAQEILQARTIQSQHSWILDPQRL